MLPLIYLCFVNLLELSAISGNQPNKMKTDNSYIENPPFVFPGTPRGYLPSTEEEYFDSKHNKIIKKRSAGRAVDLPADAVQMWKDRPISDLSTTIMANKQAILDSHNEYRRKAQPSACNMLELKWNDEAAKTADAWAKKCVQGHSPKSLRTITNYTCGENIFLSPVKVGWPQATDLWYGEHVDFCFGKGNLNDQVTGHYTQLVAAQSCVMGCSIAECPNLVNKFNFVCHYCPPGNRKPIEYPYKSGKPCGECPNSCEKGLCTNPCLYMDRFVDCPKYRTGDTCGSDQSLINDCPAMCKCTKGEIR